MAKIKLLTAKKKLNKFFMVVYYGPPDISKLEKELKKLGTFNMPADLELRTMEQLHERYRKNGKIECVRATEMFRLLGISDGSDVSILTNSRFISLALDGTHECFKLTPDGIRYMDNFYPAMLRRYSELAGLVKNGEMVNTDKRSRARQWAKEYLGTGKVTEEKESRWWEKTWVQIIMLLGAIAGIIGLFFAFS